MQARSFLEISKFRKFFSWYFSFLNIFFIQITSLEFLISSKDNIFFMKGLDLTRFLILLYWKASETIIIDGLQSLIKYS